MPSTLVAQLDGQTASPTPAPSSAPRTETMTAAPASAPSSQLEVHNIPLASAPHSHLCLLTTNLVKHCYPPPCKCPEVHFIPTPPHPPANIKLLLTYSCAFFCSVSWPEIQLIQPFPPWTRTLWHIAFAGWWFEACGPSNLNGIYYPSSSSVVRYNGIKWYYWKGPNMMATMTTMMVRPANFWWHDVRWSVVPLR